MKVIAHRGANKKAPENSIESIILANQEGADCSEIDIRLSKDLVPFVCHDDCTSRLTNGDLLISKSLSSELDLLLLENAEPLVRLENVFALCSNQLKNTELHLDIKSTNPKIGSVISRLLNTFSTDLIKRVTISSFDLDILLRFKNHHSLNSLSNLAFLWPDLDQNLPWQHHLTNKAIKSNPLKIFNQIYHKLNQIDSKFIHPWTKFWDRNLMELSKKHHLAVNTWSSIHEYELDNHYSTWSKLKDLQVDGHCTNYPLEFKQFLNNRIEAANYFLKYDNTI